MSKILELLFPPRCLICECAGLHFCQNCRVSIVDVLKQTEITGLPLSAGALYGETLSQLILMAKEENISAARNVLVDLLVYAYVKLDISEARDRPLALIPIPSSRSANRKRGYRHSLLLAQGVRRRLQSRGEQNVEVIDLLKVNRKISDMSTLNKEQRSANVSEAYSITSLRNESRVDGRVVILLDDLATTGSSIGEAMRCLRAVKIEPSGAISAGVSPHLIS